jgi:hypothetical protein
MWRITELCFERITDNGGPAGLCPLKQQKMLARYACLRYSGHPNIPNHPHLPLAYTPFLFPFSVPSASPPHGTSGKGAPPSRTHAGCATPRR